MLKSIATATAAIACAAATMAAGQVAAAEVQIAATGPVVELTVMEQTDAAPDLVLISAGVTTEAQTAVEALRLNSAEMRKVIDRIKSLGIAERDIQTTGISVNARYDYDDRTRQQVFRGYVAGNRVSVKLRNVERTGQVLDALVAAGANDIGGPTFSLEDDEAAKAAARASAVKRARAQALEYARMAGYSDLRLLEISEVIQGNVPMPMYRETARAIAVTAQSADAPVQPGQVSTGVSITVKYEMTR